MPHAAGLGKFQSKVQLKATHKLKARTLRCCWSPAMLGRHAIESKRCPIAAEGQAQRRRFGRVSQRRESIGGSAARCDHAGGHIALGHVWREATEQTHPHRGVRGHGHRVDLESGGELEAIARNGPHLRREAAHD